MELSETTKALLSKLETTVNRKLDCPADLGLLIELASTPAAQKMLDDASFCSKFLVRTMSIMRRIGPDGNGYEQLAREFATNLERVRDLLRTLTETSGEAKSRFLAIYLDMSPEALVKLMMLLGDLARFKNMRMDEARGANSRDTAE